MNWFILALKNTFNFKGRARRKEFGWFHLTTLLIELFVLVIVGFAEQLKLSDLAEFLSISHEIWSYSITLTIISLNTRRLHDLGWSGWWQLLMWLPLGYLYWETYRVTGTIGEGAFRQAMDASNLMFTVCILWMIVCLIFLLLLLFDVGDKHANKYGESPKYPSTATENDSTDLVV